LSRNGTERERGPEAGEEGHDDADQQDDEHLRREVPRQVPEVDERQEHAEAQRVVHRHAAVHLPPTIIRRKPVAGVH
jgi:hypothetical protein